MAYVPQAYYQKQYCTEIIQRENIFYVKFFFPSYIIYGFFSFLEKEHTSQVQVFINYFLCFQLLGGACFSHGPYTFYKAVRIGNGRVLRLGSFFLTKLWSDADLVSIGELQLLWMDSRGPNQPLASLRLYFLPENTPDGRRDTHGEVSYLKDIWK